MACTSDKLSSDERRSGISSDGFLIGVSTLSWLKPSAAAEGADFVVGPVFETPSKQRLGHHWVSSVSEIS
jgi:thiamine monophosphate synthase